MSQIVYFYVKIQISKKWEILEHLKNVQKIFQK